MKDKILGWLQKRVFLLFSVAMLFVQRCRGEVLKAYSFNIKRIILFLLVLLLAGCATIEGRYDRVSAEIAASQTLKLERDAKLNTWIGESEDSLIAVWGQPATISPNLNPELVPELRTALNQGKRILMYAVWGKVVTGGPRTQLTYNSGFIGNTPYSGTSSTLVGKPFETTETPAVTYFIIDNSGKIESWKDNRMLIQQASYPPIKPSNKK